MRTSVVTFERLTVALVTSEALAPTHRGNSSSGGGGSSQQLVIATGLLLFLVLTTTSLGSSAHFSLGTLPRFWSKWDVPGTALCGPSTLVRQAEELCDILDVMRGKLLQHLLIPHTLVKYNRNKSIGDMRNGVANLGKPLNEGAQRFPWTLLHDVEIGLITRPRVGTLKVGRELTIQLLSGGERALRQVHES
jgi:hypothetical protein